MHGKSENHTTHRSTHRQRAAVDSLDADHSSLDSVHRGNRSRFAVGDERSHRRNGLLAGGPT